jgi:heterodisulfide reductase subunit C
MDKDALNFIETLEEISGTSIYACYDCGKCSSGCPFVYKMDHTVNQIINYIKMGQKEKVLSSNAPWICSSCLTCSVRCPREVDIAAVMEAVREFIIRNEPERMKQIKLTDEMKEKLPNIALVGSFRKQSEL